MAGAVAPLDLLGVGNLVNGAIQGAANRKVSREGLNVSQNQNVFDAQMKARAEQRAAQSDAYRKALMGAFGAHATDSTFGAAPPSADGTPAPQFRAGFNTRVPNMEFGGGSRISALGPETPLAAQALQAQAMAALLNPQPIDPLKTIQIGKNQKYGH